MAAAGFQFVHMDGHSQARAKKGAGKGSRPISEILAEAKREPGNHPHIKEPIKPVVLAGGSFEDFEGKIAVGLKRAKEVNGKAVRKDQRIVVSIVASHPAAMADIWGDDEALSADLVKQVEEWEKRTIAWAETWAKAQGGSLGLAVAHYDESHPHLHLYVIPDPERGMKADTVHPGRAAHNAAWKAALAAGQDGKSALKEAGRAFRAAMRDFQDEFHGQVGVESGLTRIGPARRRLTREAWRAEQGTAVQAAASIAEAKEAAKGVWDFAVEKLGKAEQQEIDLRQQIEEYQQATLKMQGAIKGLQQEKDRISALAMDIRRTFDEVSRVVASFKADALDLVDKAIEYLPEYIRVGIKTKINTLDNASDVLPGLIKKLDNATNTPADFYDDLVSKLEPLPPLFPANRNRDRDKDDGPSPFD